MNKVLIALMSLLLLACSQAMVPKFDSPWYRVPLGSQLILHQPLTIPANRARIFIQNGRVFNRHPDIDQYYPYCEFEIRTLKVSDQVIQADRFRVHKLSRRIETSLQPVLLASLSDSQFDTPLVAYNTEFYLSSDKQPDVYRLACMYWTDDSMDAYLSQNQINATLGDLFSFVITD
jgi:hypothetical protein